MNQFVPKELFGNDFVPKELFEKYFVSLKKEQFSAEIEQFQTKTE